MNKINILVKLAWRNIWRNKRRTAITLASIAFGLCALLFQQSIIKSLQNQIIEKSTRTYTGHLQVFSKETTDLKVPEARIENPSPIYAAVQTLPDVDLWGPKLIFTGLISSPFTSKGVLVVGIDPLKEKELTTIHSYIVEGGYIEPAEERSILIGVKLAKEMDVKLGEKIVVMVQGSDGSLSAELFRLKGLFQTGSPVYDGQIVYVPLSSAQRLLVCGEEISVISMHLKNVEAIESAQEKLAKLLEREPVQVVTWRESSHEIVSIQKFQDAILLIVLVIIFGIVALGIFNTLLMSFFERIREFGLMLALGSKPIHVATLILLEAVFLGILGMVLGNILGSLLILYFGKNGIPLPIGDVVGYWMPFDKVIYLKFAWKELIFSSLAAVLTSILSAIFPAMRAARLQVAQALRHY